MTPTLTQILQGVMMSLTVPPPPEAGPEYTASRVGMIGMMAMMASTEAERGIETRIWENGAIRQVLRRAAGTTYDADAKGQISAAVDTPDTDLTLSALDAANASLRRLLTDLHKATEEAGDKTLDHIILRLYRDMAVRRRADLGR